jgi:MFS family permease
MREAARGLLAANASFRRYWIARTVSIAGSQLARVALTVFVYQLGGGAAGVSTLLLAFTLPRLVGPLAGTIADRLDNKRLMVGCDAAQALLFAVLAWVRWWPGVVMLVIAATACSTLYLPASRGSVPALAGRENLARANALLAIGSNTAMAVGPAVAGVMLTFGSPRPALLVNAASFIFSAVLTLGVTGLRPGTAAADDGGPVTVFGAARAGLAVAWRNRVARTLAIMLLPSVGFASLDNAALIFLVRHGFHASAGAYGWVVTAFSLGMVAVPVALAAARGQIPSRILFYGGQCLYGVATVVTGLSPGLGLGTGAQVVAGDANGMETVGLDTLLAESTPDKQLGVVFGAVYTTPFAGQLVAYLAATPLIVAFGARTTFVISGVGVLLVLAWTMLVLPARVKTDPGQ